MAQASACPSLLISWGSSEREGPTLDKHLPRIQGLVYNLRKRRKEGRERRILGSPPPTPEGALLSPARITVWGEMYNIVIRLLRDDPCKPLILQIGGLRPRADYRPFPPGGSAHTGLGLRKVEHFLSYRSPKSGQ